MKNIIILLVFVLISNVCNGKKRTYTYTDTTFNHIEFSEIVFTLDMKTKDTLDIEGALKQRTDIEGIPCYGAVSFNKNWDLKYFTLAEDHTFADQTFPKDTYIGLNIERHSLKPHYLLTVAGADSVNTCKFPSNHSINGIICDSNVELLFSTKWNLRACVLGDDDTIKGNELKKGSLIILRTNGSFLVYCLYDPMIQGHHCSGTSYTHWMWQGGGGIRFYPSGRLDYFIPVEDVEIQGVFCKSTSLNWGVSLYESGMLKKCTSAIDQTIAGVLYEKKFILTFDEEGNVIESYKD